MARNQYKVFFIHLTFDSIQWGFVEQTKILSTYSDSWLYVDKDTHIYLETLMGLVM